LEITSREVAAASRSTEALEVRLVRPEEIPALLDFYRGHCGHGDRVAQLFEWRASAPGRANRPWGAWSKGEFLGTVNAVPCPIAGGGRRIDAIWQQDSIVSPAARRRGVATELVESAAAARALVLAKGISASMYKLRKSIGFRDAPNSTYLIRVLRTWGVRGSWRRRLAAPFLSLRALSRQTAAAGPAPEVRQVDAFGRAYDDIAERALHSPWCGQWKPADYLTWRYLRCPSRTYTILEARLAQRPLGAAVMRLGAPGSADAWLVDLVADLADPILARTLIEAAVRRARENGAALLWTFASSNRARELLADAGFANSHTTPLFTYRPAGSAEDPIAAAEWNFWHGDGDTELYP